MKKPVLNTKELKGDNFKITNKEIDYDSKHLTGADISETELEEIRLEQCRLEEITFNQVKIKEGKILDCIFEKCSFAGAILDELLISRTEVKSSWMQGTQLPGCLLGDVHTANSKLNLANLRYGKIKDCVFESCDLSEADFLGATLERVVFKNCILKDSQFSQAKLKQVSLKGSDIENIRIDREAFTEVTVDTAQAIYLASLFGLKIED